MQDQLRTPGGPPRPRALVWIDARAAVIVRWEDHEALIDRLDSDVPSHHKSMGHVRHDPSRHGGGTPDRVETRREDYLDRFLKEVVQRLPAGRDLTVMGPGTVHEHLASAIREHDVEHHEDRDVESHRAARMTDGQLVAMLRDLQGDMAPRVIDQGPPRAHAFKGRGGAPG